MKKRKTLRKPWNEQDEVNSVSYGPYKGFYLVAVLCISQRVIESAVKEP